MEQKEKELHDKLAAISAEYTENLDSFTDGFTDIKIKLSTFIMMCANTNRQIIRYLRKDIIPPILAPSERQLADDALREIATRLHNQNTICNTKDTPIVMLPDGERDDDADYIYLLYTLTADNQITYYRSENPRQTILRKKQLAEVFTKAEAQAKTMFADEDGRFWHVEKVNKVIAKESEDEQPEAKKRTAYALCDYIDGEPSYFCAEYAELYIKRGKENVQVFRTKEDAEFYNAIFMARHPNQSEMYVVEIEY